MKDDYVRSKLRMNPFVFFSFLLITIIFVIIMLVMGVGAVSSVTGIIKGLGQTVPLPIGIAGLVLLIVALNTRHKDNYN